MTKAEFIDAVNAKIGGSKKDTAALVQATFDTVAGAISDGGRFTYPGFGTFKVKERAARPGRNPQTGASIQIPASKSVGFKPSATFKDGL